MLYHEGTLERIFMASVGTKSRCQHRSTDLTYLRDSELHVATDPSKP